MTPSALSCRRRVVCALLWCVRPVSVRVCPGRGLCVGLCWTSAAQALVCLLAPGFFVEKTKKKKVAATGRFLAKYMETAQNPAFI